jgi:hypothetical protein
MAVQGTVTSSDLVQGDTLLSTQITYLSNGNPIDIASAIYSINAPYGLVYSGPCVVIGNVVTTPQVDGSVTQCWPARLLYWDVEITTSAGVKRTYINGSFNLLPSSQFN